MNGELTLAGVGPQRRARACSHVRSTLHAAIDERRARGSCSFTKREAEGESSGSAGESILRTMQKATGDDRQEAVAAPLAENTEATVRKAEPRDVAVLARVLARAFDQDPFINWLVRQDERRRTRMEWTFEVMLSRMSSELNETYTTSELGGAALWKRPGEFKLPLAQQLALLPKFPRGMGWGRVPGFLRMLQHMEGLHERLVPEPHFYLFVLGVEPERQGRGLGSRLLAPVLARCDGEGKRAYLETARADNLPFYARHGFQVAELVARAAWPKLWLMRREPRDGAAVATL